MFLSLACLKHKSHFLYKILTSSSKYRWMFHIQRALWHVMGAVASLLSLLLACTHVPAITCQEYTFSFYSIAPCDGNVSWQCEIFFSSGPAVILGKRKHMRVFWEGRGGEGGGVRLIIYPWNKPYVWTSRDFWDACLDNTVSYSNETKTSLFVMQLFAWMSTAKQGGPLLLLYSDSRLWF